MASEQAEEIRTDSEVFVPDLDEGDGGCLWVAQRLSISNTILLVRLLAKVIAHAAITISEDYDEDTKLTEDNIMDVITILDAPMLRTVLCVVTGKDKDYIEETYTLERAITVILEFWKLENMDVVLGKAKRMAGNQEFKERNVGSPN